MSPAAPWSTARLGLDLARAFSTGGGVTVAVVDTGITPVPALDAAVDAGVDVAGGRRAGRADSDCAGRGTFAAGLIAARPRDRSGVVGVAPSARLLPIRVSRAEEPVRADVLAAGIDAAVSGGATVVAVTASAPADSAALRAAVLGRWGETCSWSHGRPPSSTGIASWRAFPPPTTKSSRSARSGRTARG